MKYLRKDIFSNFQHLVYGKAGDEVEVVGDHVTVMIVEGKNGNRFPVATGDLTEDVAAVEAQNQPAVVSTTPSRTAKAKKQTSPIQTLF